MSRRQWFKSDDDSAVQNHKWVKPNSKIEEKNTFSRQVRVTEKDLPEDEKYEIDEEAVLKEIEAMHDKVIEDMEKHMSGKK